MLKRFLASACLIGIAMNSAPADDWPQWMGPQRDNVWREKGILKKFPAGGPKVLWSGWRQGVYHGLCHR
jgi:outer membrane protein assembly factor BamB